MILIRSLIYSFQSNCFFMPSSHAIVYFERKSFLFDLDAGNRTKWMSANANATKWKQERSNNNNKSQSNFTITDKVSFELVSFFHSLSLSCCHLFVWEFVSRRRHQFTGGLFYCVSHLYSISSAFTWYYSPHCFCCCCCHWCIPILLNMIRRDSIRFVYSFR